MKLFQVLLILFIGFGLCALWQVSLCQAKDPNLAAMQCIRHEDIKPNFKRK